MKAFLHRVFPLAAALSVAAMAAAQENAIAGSPDAGVTGVETQMTAPVLAPGVADIARMAQARVSDPVILAYIENSGTVYNLDAGQIVYLRDAGVSEPVLAAMLNQRQKYAQPLSATPAPAPQQTAEAATDSVQAVPTYPVPEPESAPVSTVHVIPYQPTWPSYGCYYYVPLNPCATAAYPFGGFTYYRGYRPYPGAFCYTPATGYRFGHRRGPFHGHH